MVGDGCKTREKRLLLKRLDLTIEKLVTGLGHGRAKLVLVKRLHQSLQLLYFELVTTSSVQVDHLVTQTCLLYLCLEIK
jgi:hypothetical protein